MAPRRAPKTPQARGGFSFLLAFFGLFAVLSIAALIRLQGNPIFLFTLLLCLASLVTIWRLDREEVPARAPKAGRRARRR